MAEAQLPASFQTGQAPATAVLLHQAETGRSWVLQQPQDASVRLLKQALEAVSGTPVAQQILLLEGYALETDRALGEYGLPSGEPRSAMLRPVISSLKSMSPLPS